MREFETRRDRAADKRPVAETMRRLPGVRRHDGLRAFAGGEIAPERHALAASLFLRDFERQWRAVFRVIPKIVIASEAKQSSNGAVAWPPCWIASALRASQ